MENNLSSNVSEMVEATRSKIVAPRVVSNSDSVAQLLEKMRVADKTKDVEKGNSVTAIKTKRLASAKRRSAYTIMSGINSAMKTLDFIQNDINSNLEKANEFIENSAIAYAELDKKFDNDKLELMKTQNTKEGKEMLISYHEEMIQKLKDELSAGLFDKVVDDKYNESLANLIYKYEKDQASIKKKYITDQADVIMYKTLQGINPDGSPAKRQGLEQKKIALMDEIRELKIELEKAERFESMSINDKGNDVFDMVGKVTEDTESLDSYFTDKDLVNESSELEDMKS